MEISVRKYKEKHIVDVRGELDLYNAFRLKETVQKMVAMAGQAKGVIDSLLSRFRRATGTRSADE